MKAVFYCITASMFSLTSLGQNMVESQAIRKLIGSFISDLNKADFSALSGYGTKEWVHISSSGAAAYGRDEVVAAIFYFHKNFMKEAKIAMDNMTVRMLSPEAATVTVIQKIDTYTDSKGIKYTHQKQLKTYVVVKQNEKWLITLDQSTVIVPQ